MTEADAPFLHAMAAFGGSSKPPCGYARAEQIWRRAESLAAEGRLETAADSFLAAAHSLMGHDDGPYGPLALRCRGWAYDNAATCWLAAGREAVAERKLRERLAADPGAADGLTGTLDRVARSRPK